TSPSSVLSRPEIAFSEVDLPAPLAPSSATIAPLGTSRLRPRSTRMTSSYTTSMLRTERRGGRVSVTMVVRAVSSVSVMVIVCCYRRVWSLPPSPRLRGEGEGTSPPQPFRLALQLDGLDLFELDGALGHQIVEIAVGRARDLGAVEIDRRGRAVI